MEEAEVGTGQPPRTKLPPNGIGAHAPTRGTTTGTTAIGATTTRMTHPPIVTHLRFGTPDPPPIPIRARGGTERDKHTNVEHHNRFAPLRHQGSESSGQESEALSSAILRGGTASGASSSRGIRGRDPIPLTPRILFLLDRLEPDKGRQARLLTEHLTGQRTLPCTEQELQIQLKRKADREIRRHHAAAETAANKAATKQMEAQEAAMAAHLAEQAMAAALAA